MLSAHFILIFTFILTKPFASGYEAYVQIFLTFLKSCSLNSLYSYMLLEIDKVFCNFFQQTICIFLICRFCKTTVGIFFMMFKSLPQILVQYLAEVITFHNYYMHPPSIVILNYLPSIKFCSTKYCVMMLFNMKAKFSWGTHLQ